MTSLVADTVETLIGTKKSKKHVEVPVTPKSPAKEDRSEQADAPMTPNTPGDATDDNGTKKKRNPFAHMTVEQRNAHKETMKKLKKLRAAQEKAYDFDGMMKNLRKFKVPKKTVNKMFVTCLVPLSAEETKDLVTAHTSKALINLVIASFICQIQDGKKTMTHKHVINAAQKIGFDKLLGI